MWGAFENRQDAGRKLADVLYDKYNGQNVVVLSLPRGGVPIGHIVAQRLGAPHDIVVPRKIGCPGHEEFAIGALTEEGDVVLNEDVIRSLALERSAIQATIEREKKEAQRRLQAYRGDKPKPNLSGKTVILIDDGVATGSTARAALRTIKSHNPQKVVLATPCMPADTKRDMEEQKICDDVVSLIAPHNFRSVGQWYKFFDQTSDEEVIRLLQQSPAPLKTK
ncbi:Phosphoribosyltransferase [Balamuthia mandrillaris]